MPDHLLLPERVPLESRRQGPGGGPGTPSRNPRQHGRQLEDRLGTAIERSRPIRVIEGIDPAQVFKISARGRVTDQTFAGKGLEFLGETADWTYFVLSVGEQPDKLIEDLRAYGAGPDEEGAHAVNYTFFDGVDDIQPYGPEDRIGPGLPSNLDSVEGTLLVDVLAWPSPDHGEAERRLQEIRRAVAELDAEEIASDARARFTILR